MLRVARSAAKSAMATCVTSVYAQTPDAPWRGRSAWAACSDYGGARSSARIQHWRTSEQRSGVGAVVAVPDAKKADEDGVTAALSSMPERRDPVGRLAQRLRIPAPDEGPAGSEWHPDVAFGPNPPSGQVELRGHVAASILAAAGVPAALVASNTPAAGMRESFRQFLVRDDRAGRSHRCARSTACSGRRPGRTRLDGFGCQSDITGRATGVRVSFVKSGLDKDEAKRVAGL